MPCLHLPDILGVEKTLRDGYTHLSNNPLDQPTARELRATRVVWEPREWFCSLLPLSGTEQGSSATKHPTHRVCQRMRSGGPQALRIQPFGKQRCLRLSC